MLSTLHTTSSRLSWRASVLLAAIALAAFASPLLYVSRATLAQSGDPFGGTTTPPQPAVEFLPKLTPVEEKILLALEKPTVMDFIETPLQDAVDYLKDFHGIEIQLDTKVLEGCRYRHRLAGHSQVARYFATVRVADPAGSARHDIRHPRRSLAIHHQGGGLHLADHPDLPGRRPARGQGLRQPHRSDYQRGRFQIVGRIWRRGQHLPGARLEKPGDFPDSRRSRQGTLPVAVAARCANRPPPRSRSIQAEVPEHLQAPGAWPCNPTRMSRRQPPRTAHAGS